ncbi:MAG: rod shape-determining protein RodA, partial [Burkholderiaceae bacterium]
MAAGLNKFSLWQRLSPIFKGFDGLLALAVCLLACAGLVAMYSS